MRRDYTRWIRAALAAAAIGAWSCGTAPVEPAPVRDRADDGMDSARWDPTGRIRTDGASSDVGDAGSKDADGPAGLLCLRRAHGEAIASVETDEGGEETVLRMEDGTAILWDDGEEKSFEEKLARPDLEDQMSIAYPVAWLEKQPSPNDDPGRIRVRDFFASVYGHTAEEVRAALVRVPWPGGRTVAFNARNGAAAALERVSRGLSADLPSELIGFVAPPSGTYNRRAIASTDRPSAHSYGIAIDINAARSDYWRWSGGPGPLVYRNRIPRGVVEIFEREGFIWGGKWYHYDTMHFEYRPELLDPACAR